MKAKVLTLKQTGETVRFCYLENGECAIVGGQPVMKVDACDIASGTGNLTRNAVNLLNGAMGWIDNNQVVEVMKRG